MMMMMMMMNIFVLSGVIFWLCLDTGSARMLLPDYIEGNYSGIALCALYKFTTYLLAYLLFLLKWLSTKVAFYDRK